MEESAAGDPVDEQVFLLLPGGVVDGAAEAGSGEPTVESRVPIHVCWLFGAGGEIGVPGGKGGEVVRAQDVGRGLLQDGEIEGIATRPDVGSQHRRTDAVFVVAEKDAILVGFSVCAVTGVEVFGYGFDGENADAGRKGAVEGVLEVRGGDRRGKREGGDLGESVDPGVGAARTLWENDFSGDVVDGLC